MTFSKSILTITSIFTLGFTTNLEDYKATVPFEHVVYQSEIIATGEISKINKLNYEFEITRLIKGEGKVCDVITIKKFGEWMCEMRQKKHKVGQELIIYVKDLGDNGWNLINGSTGEIIVVHNNPAFFSKIEFIESTNIVLNCFEKTDNLKSKINCNNDYIELNRKSNSFFNHVMNQMETLERILK